MPVSSSYFTAFKLFGWPSTTGSRRLNNKQRTFSRKRSTMYLIGLNVGKLSWIIVDVTNKSINPIKLYTDYNEIPHSNTGTFLRMTLDARLHWKLYVKIKREQLNIKLAKLYWFLCKRTMLSNYNKQLLYKQILKQVWTYGIHL